jgi:hypothetical protein
MKIVGKNKNGLYVRIQMWNGAYKQACTVTTFKSLISNMMIGVTEVSFPIKIFKNTPMLDDLFHDSVWCAFLGLFCALLE